MSNEAQAAFERGKKLLDENNPAEAISAFAKSIRLASDVAEYHAWYAQALNSTGKYDEALREAFKAIQLDPKAGKAYRQRGHANKGLKQFDGAIRDYSQAIQIDPLDNVAYGARGDTYWTMKNYENAFLDYVQQRRLSSEPLVLNEHSSADANHNSKNQLWYKTIHQHATQNIIARLRTSDEKFVGYWPCWLTWGKKSQINSYKGDAYTHTSWSYGCGYVCLTDKNIYLFSLGQISQKYPLYDTGLVMSILAVGFAHTDRMLEKTDQSWTIPYRTVNGAQINDQALQLVTPAMTWEICQHFTDDLPEILAGINLGVSGRFSARESIPIAISPVQQSNTDVVGLLKQLGDLKSQGIITDAEFEQKKKDLLARL